MSIIKSVMVLLRLLGSAIGMLHAVYAHTNVRLLPLLLCSFTMLIIVASLIMSDKSSVTGITNLPGLNVLRAVLHNSLNSLSALFPTIFSALADRTRLEMVILLLNEGAMSVQEITHRLNKS